MHSPLYPGYKSIQFKDHKKFTNPKNFMALYIISTYLSGFDFLLERECTCPLSPPLDLLLACRAQNNDLSQSFSDSLYYDLAKSNLVGQILLYISNEEDNDSL